MFCLVPTPSKILDATLRFHTAAHSAPPARRLMVYYRQHNAIEWEKAKWDAEVEVCASAAGDSLH